MKLRLMETPSRSPELNPIEQLHELKIHKQKALNNLELSKIAIETFKSHIKFFRPPTVEYMATDLPR